MENCIFCEWHACLCVCICVFVCVVEFICDRAHVYEGVPS